jgi:type VI secretion system secreted protein VgrG
MSKPVIYTGNGPNQLLSIDIKSTVEDIKPEWLHEFWMVEKLSEPFQMVMVVDVPKPITSTDIISKAITVSIIVHLEDKPEETRYFNGVVTQLKYLGEGDKLYEDINGRPHRYQILAEPQLCYFLGPSQNNRIFLSMKPSEKKGTKTRIDFLKSDLLKPIEYDFGGLEGKYEKADYYIQYNETDQHIVERWLQYSGIPYRFKHEDGKHTMVMWDTTIYEPAGQLDLEFISRFNDTGAIQKINAFENLTLDNKVLPTKWTGSQYTWEQPAKMVDSKAGEKEIHTINEYDPNYFAPGYDDQQSADIAKVRQIAQGGINNIVTIPTFYPMLVPGAKVTLKNNPILKAEKLEELLIISSEHYYSPEKGYTNTFTGMSSKLRYCSPLTKHAPLIPEQIAEVKGQADGDDKSDKDIYTDKYGRVVVECKFDTNKSNIWVREQEDRASKKHGSQSIHRAGEEVLLRRVGREFIVVASIYNAVTARPFTLPDNKAIVGWQGQTTPEGGDNNGGPKNNSMYFDDKKNAQLIMFESAKDYTCKVDNNKATTVWKDLTEDVKQNKTMTTEGEEKRTTTKDHTFEVSEGNYVHKVSKGTSDRTVAGAVTVTNEKGRTVKVTDTFDITAKEFTVTAGNAKLSMKSGNITLSVGGSSVEITTSGVTAKGSTSVEMSAPTATVKGETMATVQGATATLKGDAAANVNAPAVKIGP